ncbi:MAG: hypothetical protein OXC40_06440, partial [Proteobacteria bacterium]|nr:hypothetical protein [Pseudomonadota bacterium]
MPLQNHSADSPSGSTRIIWCVEANHLNTHAEKLLSSRAQSVCIESFLDQQEKTLTFLKNTQPKKSEEQLNQPLPAIMLALTPQERFPLDFSGEPLTLTSQTKVIITSRRDQLAQYPDGHQIFYLGNTVNTNSFLWNSLVPGDDLFIGFDSCMVKVSKYQAGELHCDVVRGGRVTPGIALYIPVKRGDADTQIKNFLKKSLKALQDAKVHYLLLPGCLDLNTLHDLRNAFPPDDPLSPWLISRVDSQLASKRVPDIIPMVDGFMIAR